jgi:small subunit ribosomal protein S18
MPPRVRRQRIKVCKFCEAGVDYLDYKDEKTLRRFVNDRGKIIPRRMSGVCEGHQRQLSTAIKHARQIALLPFVAEAFK